jgi:hypothetical protein
MLTEEGVDSAETIIRPLGSGGWRVEFPTPRHVAAFARTQIEAVLLAKRIEPEAAIRMLPAREYADLN